MRLDPENQQQNSFTEILRWSYNRVFTICNSLLLFVSKPCKFQEKFYSLQHFFLEEFSQTKQQVILQTLEMRKPLADEIPFFGSVNNKTVLIQFLKRILVLRLALFSAQESLADNVLEDVSSNVQIMLDRLPEKSRQCIRIHNNLSNYLTTYYLIPFHQIVTALENVDHGFLHQACIELNIGMAEMKSVFNLKFEEENLWEELQEKTRVLQTPLIQEEIEFNQATLGAEQQALVPVTNTMQWRSSTSTVSNIFWITISTMVNDYSAIRSMNFWLMEQNQFLTRVHHNIVLSIDNQTNRTMPARTQSQHLLQPYQQAMPLLLLKERGEQRSDSFIEEMIESEEENQAVIATAFEQKLQLRELLSQLQVLANSSANSHSKRIDACNLIIGILEQMHSNTRHEQRKSILNAWKESVREYLTSYHVADGQNQLLRIDSNMCACMNEWYTRLRKETLEIKAESPVFLQLLQVLEILRNVIKTFLNQSSLAKAKRLRGCAALIFQDRSEVDLLRTSPQITAGYA